MRKQPNPARYFLLNGRCIDGHPNQFIFRGSDLKSAIRMHRFIPAECFCGKITRFEGVYDYDERVHREVPPLNNPWSLEMARLVALGMRADDAADKRENSFWRHPLRWIAAQRSQSGRVSAAVRATSLIFIPRKERCGYSPEQSLSARPIRSTRKWNGPMLGGQAVSSWYEANHLRTGQPGASKSDGGVRIPHA